MTGGDPGLSSSPAEAGTIRGLLDPEEMLFWGGRLWIHWPSKVNFPLATYDKFVLLANS
jgi:hypothetical protein